MILPLSYPISRESPLYPGTPEISINLLRSIEKGDATNNSIITLPAHAGTHIDLPRHFCPHGKTSRNMLEYGARIAPVYCYDLSKKAGEYISSADIISLPVNRNARGILIRTGFYRFRQSDPDTYAKGYPWIHQDVPDLIRTLCPDLILFGTDTISISNPSQRAVGHQTHRSFLCREPPIMLLEDANLSYDCLTGRELVIRIYPVIVDELDGVPVVALIES
jgi:kynurenine formamidase